MVVAPEPRREVVCVHQGRLLCEREQTEGAHLGTLYGLPTVAAVRNATRQSLDDRLTPLFDRTATGDVLTTNVSVARLEIEGFDPEPDSGLEWENLDTLRQAWATARRFVSPSLADVLERRERPSAGWTVAPHLRMLPVRTPTLPPATHTNVFLVGTERAVLVEPASPYPEELARIEAWVAQSGTRPEAILATHHHPDHIGGALALSESLGLPLWAHEMTAERLSDVVTFERLLQDNEEIAVDGTTLRAVYTPGHAPGHLCFVDEATGIMLAGDMVAGVGTIIVEPVDGDMELYLASLETMRATKPRAMLPAHGGLIADPDTLLTYYKEHRLMREGKVLEALKRHGGLATPSDLVADAYDDAPKSVWPLAIRSIEAHLIKLARDGAVTFATQGWTACL